jgi:hypothetical protein
MSPVIEGGLEYQNAGAPVNGTNEVQTLTIGGTPDGGTFKLKYDGQITAAITWSATTGTLLANIQAALRALATIGSAGVTCTEGSLASGVGTVTITFGGNLAKLAVPTISVYLNSLTGTAPTLAMAETTPGVTATARGAAVGAVLMDTTNKVLYKNDGTALEPKWLQTFGQSMGTLSSANDVSGIPLTASVNKAHAVHADTGGVALTAGNIRASLNRFLIGTAITSGADISTYGEEALLKMIVSVNVGGNQAGKLGHLESAGTLTLTGTINTVRAGVTSFLDLAANATVAAGTVVSAYGVNPANFGTTMNGRSSIIHVTNPMAGTWGSFLDMSTATGLTQDSAAGATGDKFLKVYLNGVLYTIAMERA